MARLLERSCDTDQPGVSAIVTRDGKPIFRAARGMANLELGVALQPEMVFRIASITKQFTGVAILMLQARGKLSVNDRITRFLPKHPTHGHKITIEHLLRHTSGIQSYTAMPAFWKHSQQHMTVDEHIAFFKDAPIQSAPGERWNYNNSGYFLLGAIIEKVSGERYADFLKKQIFARLGMAHTHYDEPTQLIPGRVTGYQNGATGLQIADYLSTSWPYAAGALVSNVDDLARWDAALYTNQLVKRRDLQAAWTPGTLNDGTVIHYGYGWALNSYKGLTCVEHSGGINGFLSFGIRIPEKRVYAAVLMNTVAPKLDPQLIAFKLAALACGAPYRDPKPVRVTTPKLRPLIGRYAIVGMKKAIVTLALVQGRFTIQTDPARAPTVLRPARPRAGAAFEFFAPDTLLRYCLVMPDKRRNWVLQAWDRDRLAYSAKRSVSK